MRGGNPGECGSMVAGRGGRGWLVGCGGDAAFLLGGSREVGRTRRVAARGPEHPPTGLNKCLPDRKSWRISRLL